MKQLLLDAHYILGRPKDHTSGVIAVSEEMKDMAMFSELDDSAILGIIGLARFGKSSLKKVLKEASFFPKVKVLRDASPSLDPIWQNGVKMASKLGYSCEIEVGEEMFFPLSRVVEENPRVSFILALNRPIRKSLILKELSHLQNIVVKIITDLASYEQLKGTTLDIIDLFSTERVMFGSFSEKRYEELIKIVGDFSEEEKENLFYTSAKKWYNLIS